MSGRAGSTLRRLCWLSLTILTLLASLAKKGPVSAPPDLTGDPPPPLAQRVRSLDLLSRVGAVPLAKGLAVVPLWGQPDQAFHNPAGIAGVGRLSLTHNHSFRHFPVDEEVDLIDADTEVVAVPLPGGFTAAYATTLRGEHGWDYLKLAGTPWEQAGFPIERSDGYRDVVAVAFSPLPLFSLGAGLVTEEARQFDERNRLLAIHQGQGMETGYLLRLLGLSWGASRLKMDFDTFDLTTRRQRGWRMWRKLTGLAFTPTPWLSLTTQRGGYRVRTPEGDVARLREPATSSLSLTLFPGLTLYLASRGGNFHRGFSLRLGPLSLTGSLGEKMVSEIHPRANGEMGTLGIYGLRLDLPW